MCMTRRIASAAAGMAMAAGLVVLGGPGAAMAAPAPPGATPRGCAPQEGYVYSHKHVYWVTNKNKDLHVTGPGGVRISLTISSGTKVHGEVTGSGKYSVAKIIKGADLNISGDLSYTQSQSVTKGASWKVPSRYAHGWLAFGFYGYRFTWKLERVDEACKPEVVAKGTGKLPGHNPGFNKGRGIAPPYTN